MAGTVSTGALAILCLQWITSGFWTELHKIPVPSTRIAYSYKAESQTLLSKERTKPAVELSMMLWQWFALKQQKSLLKPTKAKKKSKGRKWGWWLVLIFLGTGADSAVFSADCPNCQTAERQRFTPGLVMGTETGCTHIWPCCKTVCCSSGKYAAQGQLLSHFLLKCS